MGRLGAVVGSLGVIGAVMVLLASSGPAGAEQPNTFALQPQEVEVPPGDDFTVRVAIEDGTGIAAYEFTVAYDRNVVRFVAAHGGSFLEQTGVEMQCLPALVDEQSGAVTVGCYTLGRGQLATGSGTLAYLTFAAVREGESPLRFVKTSAADALANNVCEPCPARDGSVVVRASATGAPDVPKPEGTPVGTRVVEAAPAERSALPTPEGGDLVLGSPAPATPATPGRQGEAVRSAGRDEALGSTSGQEFPVAGTGSRTALGPAAELQFTTGALFLLGAALTLASLAGHRGSNVET